MPIKLWPAILITEVMPLTLEYIKNSNREVNLNMKNTEFFIKSFKDYIKLRNLPENLNDDKEPIFPKNYDQILEREHFYKSISFKGWGGGSEPNLLFFFIFIFN